MSKQAWGTTSHHAGGSSGKRSRENSDVAWKGRMRVLLKIWRRRKRKKQYNPGGSTHEAWAGLAGNQRTHWSNYDQLLPQSAFINLIKDAWWRYYMTVGGSWRNIFELLKKMKNRRHGEKLITNLFESDTASPSIYQTSNKPCFLYIKKKTKIRTFTRVDWH